MQLPSAHDNGDDHCQVEDGLPLRVVDSIPVECGQQHHKSHKRRRTTMTEQTIPLSDVEDEESSEISVVAVSEDNNVDNDDDSTSLRDVSFDLSVEKLLQLQGSFINNHNHSNSNSSQHRLFSLVEENERTLKSLLSTTEDDLDEFYCCVEAEEQSAVSSSSASYSSQWNLRAAWEFELQQSLPGIGAVLLYCVAHASTYELVTNLVYQVVYTTSDVPGDTKSRVFVVLLVLGCLLGRFSGLVWEFISNKAYRRVKLLYHNRLRCGAMDARALHWLQDREPFGDFAVGCLHTISYFMCYIAVAHFVLELAVRCDQRDEILRDLPSALYEQQQEAFEAMTKMATLLSCPARDYSPHALFDSSSPSTWDPLACHDYHHANEIEVFGPEDELFLYSNLSRNSYEHVFGIGYEAALFDTFHHMLFFASLAVSAIVTLKTCFGFSFWAGW